MEKSEILEALKKLNSLDLKDLDEEISKMQMTFEDWSKLMGEKGYWHTGFSEVLLEDREALNGNREVDFDNFKRLFKEYGKKMIDFAGPKDEVEKQIAEQSQSLQEKLDPEKKLDEYLIDIDYFKSCIEEDELDQEEIDEYKAKIIDRQSRIKRCEEYKNIRSGKSIPVQDGKDHSIGTDTNKQNDKVADFRKRLDEYRKANPTSNYKDVYDTAESVALEDEAYALGLEFDNEVELSHSREVADSTSQSIGESLMNISKGESAENVQKMTTEISRNVREKDALDGHGDGGNR